MSVKRQATSELNHENWDQEDPADQEEAGSFKIATQDILEKRVIRTAKRRTPLTGDEPKKSVFSGFGGFNKTQPASFDFLSKVTNGNNENKSKADSSVTSSLFTAKPLPTSPGTGLFSLQTSTASPSQSPFGTSTASPSQSPFGTSTASPSQSPFGTSTTSPSQSPFGPSPMSGAKSMYTASSTNATPTFNMFTSKPDSTVNDSPFKIQTVTSSTDNKLEASKSTTKTTSAVTKFDIPTTSANVAKSLFSTTSTASPFKIQTTTDTVQTTSGTVSKSESTESEKKSEDVKDESKMKYYSKLKGLNESVSDWIKKHVEQTPLCILSPIFKDYEKYLKEIQEEYESSKNKTDVKITTTAKSDESINVKPITKNSSPNSSTLFNVSPSSKSLFAAQNVNNSASEKPATFSFGITAASSTSTFTTSSPGFTFGGTTSSSQSTKTTPSPFAVGAVSTSPFSFSSNTSTTTATNGSAAGFSFGIGKPFSFNNSTQQSSEKTEDTNKDEEDDTPPKVEYTAVVEENSVYDKKCKIFVKKDGSFVEKGVGTLYIKKIEESGKHQLLVRANTNLGTILINLILVSGIPTQRMGKNNVMMVCIPTPDSKPPPTPILIRVKTSEEADELLGTLDKYKA